MERHKEDEGEQTTGILSNEEGTMNVFEYEEEYI